MAALAVLFAWRLRDAPFPVALRVILPVGGLVMISGIVGFSIQGIRQQLRPSIPRARDGVLELRMPEPVHRSLQIYSIGCGIVAIGGVMMIWHLLTEQPVTLIRGIGIAFLMLLLLCIAIMFVGASRSRRTLLAADAWGIRFQGPIKLLSIQLPWFDVASLEPPSGRSPFGSRLIARTETGRVEAIPIPALSMPVSRDRVSSLVAEIASLRPHLRSVEENEQPPRELR